MQPTRRPSEILGSSASWADSALRSLEPQEKASRANVQPFKFLLHGITVALLSENTGRLLNPRRCLRSLFEKPAQLAFGQVKLETTSWGQSDGSQKLRQCGQLVREFG